MAHRLYSISNKHAFLLKPQGKPAIKSQTQSATHMSFPALNHCCTGLADPGRAACGAGAEAAGALHAVAQAAGPGPHLLLRLLQPHHPPEPEGLHRGHHCRHVCLPLADARKTSTQNELCLTPATDWTCACGLVCSVTCRAHVTVLVSVHKYTWISQQSLNCVSAGPETASVRNPICP